MASSEHSTRVIARIAGPFLLVTALTLVTRAETAGEIVETILRDPSLGLILGMALLAAGLIIIALHQRWSRPAEIAISLLGWALALRGASLLLIPDLLSAVAAPLLQHPILFYAASAISLVLGAWLAFVGFFEKAAVEGKIS